MQKMKTLTVGGETYQVTDPEAARLGDGTVTQTHTWSGRHILDRLCPAFTQTGSLVSCTPAQGYPLGITAPEASFVTRCGKNLWDLKPSGGNPITTVRYISSDGTAVEKQGYRIVLPAGTYTFHAERIGDAGGYVYGCVNGTDGTYKAKVNLSTNTSLTSVTVTLEEGDTVYLYNGVGNNAEAAAELFGQHYNVQVEQGSTATPYVPYCGENFAPGEEVTALAGINFLWADTGSVTVTGRADPMAVLEALYTRLAELESAIINT